MHFGRANLTIIGQCCSSSKCSSCSSWPSSVSGLWQASFLRARAEKCDRFDSFSRGNRTGPSGWAAFNWKRRKAKGELWCKMISHLSTGHLGSSFACQTIGRPQRPQAAKRCNCGVRLSAVELVCGSRDYYYYYFSLLVSFLAPSRWCYYYFYFDY